MVDTGAATTIVSKELLHTLSVEISPSGTSQVAELLTATGDNINIIGTALLDAEVCHERTDIQAIVATGLDHDLIIGMDTLLSMAFIIDLQKREIGTSQGMESFDTMHIDHRDYYPIRKLHRFLGLKCNRRAVILNVFITTIGVLTSAALGYILHTC